MLQLVFCPSLESARARILMCTRLLAPGLTLLTQHRASSQILCGTATPDTQPEFEGSLLQCGRHSLSSYLEPVAWGWDLSRPACRAALGNRCVLAAQRISLREGEGLLLHGCFINLFCGLYSLLRGNCYIFTFPLEIASSTLLEGEL